MTHISVGEHLAAMVDQHPQSWMIELGQMLQELDNTDSALAASLAFDLARQPKTAQALKELISGYTLLKKELGNGSLTNNQEQTVKRALKNISIQIDKLSLIPKRNHQIKE
jgi:hypothetical protein